MIDRIGVETNRQQLVEITAEVQHLLDSSSTDNGLLTLFIQHTSASLVVQENADPSVQTDLLTWMNRLVPEHDTIYTHTAEGPDDMPAHIKSMLTQTSLCIPFENGRLLLGTWQGIYLFEHRRSAHRRCVIVHIA